MYAQYGDLSEHEILVNELQSTFNIHSLCEICHLLLVD
jgi:hypothetical protein